MPTWIEILRAIGVLAGLAAIVPGFILVHKGRRSLSRTEGAKPGAMRALCLGLAGVGVGYHLIVWSIFGHGVTFGVPLMYWWIVAVVAVVLVLGGMHYAADDIRS